MTKLIGFSLKESSHILILFSVSAISALSGGCASWNFLKSNSNSLTQHTSTQFDTEKDEIEALHQFLNSGQFEKLLSQSDTFIKKYPYSTSLNEVLYLNALAIEYFQDWSAAIARYDQIINNSLVGAKEFLALSLYRKSICLQGLEQYEKAIAGLKDALSHKEYLPLEVSEAQIPARMASIYASLKQKNTADVFTLRAEKGIRFLKSIKKASDQNWLAETLYQMGTLQQDQLNEENFYAHVLSFSRQQKYLLQTVELANPKWSPKAKDHLIENYTSFLNLIKNMRVVPSEDWAVSQYEFSEKRSEMAASIEECLMILKSFEAPKETVSAQRTEALFDLLEPLRTEVVALILEETRNKPWGLKSHFQSLQPESMTGSINLVDDSLKSNFESQHRKQALPQKRK